MHSDLTGTQWVSKEELERMFVEELDDEQYDYFVRTLTRLAEHPYSMKAEAFITRFRKQQISNLSSAAIKPLSHDANGNPYAVANGEFLSRPRLKLFRYRFNFQSSSCFYLKRAESSTNIKKTIIRLSLEHRVLTHPMIIVCETRALQVVGRPVLHKSSSTATERVASY